MVTEKKFAPPKTLGECVDALGKIDAEVSRLNALIKIKKDEYNVLEKHMLELLLKQRSKAAAGMKFRCESDVRFLPSVTDWDKYRLYIVKNNAWELLQKRPGVEAWRDRLDKKILVPGSEVYQQTVLRLYTMRKKR
jgi:hypothetical protein